MPAMSDAYNQLLDATIQHLEGLKSRGVRHVSGTPETRRALALPALRSAATPEVRSIRVEESKTEKTINVVSGRAPAVVSSIPAAATQASLISLPPEFLSPRVL